MIKRYLIMVAIIALGVIYASAQTGMVNGIVRNLYTNEPVSGANLQVKESKKSTKVLLSVVTDSAGMFKFDLSYGTYVLQSSHLSFDSYRKIISISESYSDYDIYLEPRQRTLEEVYVSSYGGARKMREVAIPMSVVEDRQLRKLSAQSPSEALAHEPGLAMTRDGIWATSVNIRGLSEQRNVTLIDGNRIETATDHAAALSTIDLNDVEQIEVIKGPASSVYGTGAMGGVVNFVTHSNVFTPKFSTGGKVYSEYQSANQLFSNHAGLHAGSKRWAVSANGTYRTASDVRTPVGTLNNSGFTDYAYSIKTAFKPRDNHELSINFQNYSADEVGLPGGSSFPKDATVKYDWVTRRMIGVGYTITDISESLKVIRVNFFSQYIDRMVENRPNAMRLITPRGQHYTNGIRLHSEWQFGQRHKVTAGTEWWQRRVETSRESRTQKNDSTVIVRGEMPIPDARFSSMGVFAQDEFTLIPSKLLLNYGGRYDFIQVTNETAVDPLYQYTTVNGKTTQNVVPQRINFASGSVNDGSYGLYAGLVYSANANNDISLSVARSFRAPSLEERFKFIDQAGNLRVGDPNIKPESGWFADLGYKLYSGPVTLSANLFANTLNNLIVEKKDSFSYVLPSGSDTTVLALKNSNVNEALLTGAELSAEWRIISRVAVFSSLSYVRGTDTKNNTSLPSIPPFRGASGIRYLQPGWFEVLLAAYWATEQPKVAAAEQPTKGFVTWNASINSSYLRVFGLRTRLIAGVDNITDVTYYHHLNTYRGLIKAEPGRNLYVKLSVNF